MNRSFSIPLLSACFLANTVLIPGQGQTIKLITGMSEGYKDLKFRDQYFLFEASVDVVHWDSLETDPGFADIQIPGYYSFGEEGSPSLPRSSILFEAGPPSYAQVRIEIMDSLIFDLGQMGVKQLVVPFSPSVSKGDPVEKILADSVLYSTDAWIGGPVIEVDYEGKMRGLSMSNLHFNPIRYNPFRNQLKVYYHVRCIIETGPATGSRQDASQAFTAIFDRVVQRAAPLRSKALQAEQSMTLVILSDTTFRETLRPLVEWKTRKGFRVVEAYRQDTLVGDTRESMKAFLEGLYKHPPEGTAPPSFLLIVGDVEQIPLSRSTGQITDLYYAEYDGGEDYIPDLFYGRISVATPGQLQGVIDKILSYEQYRFPDPSFLNKAVLIAGVDGSFAKTYGNGQINYVHELYLNEGQGNQTHMFPYPESDTGDQAILELISEGVGFVNYTGHGRVDRWENPAFRTSDIENLKNLGRYPVMIGNGCETNSFTTTECFAEALLRASGKGALAYIGCTNDSYWDEDYFWAVGVGAISPHPGYEGTSPGCFDKVFHTHGEAFELWTPTLGEMIFGGNMAVQQSSSPRKRFYWEIYQLAGDPTIVPWFKIPEIQEAIHPGILPRGVRRVDVSCAPHSYVAISRNGALLDALHASGEGFATLRIPDTLTSGKLELIISCERFIPYMEEVLLGEPSGIYLDLLGSSLSGETAGADQFLTPGEQASLDLQLVNRGNKAVSNDTLLLFSGEGSIEIQDSLTILDRIEPGDTLMVAEAFRFRSGNRLDDQARVILGIQIKGAGFPMFIKETLYAPLLVSEGISWDDRPLGNGNGKVEADEWLLCNWSLINNGHFGTGMIRGELFPESPADIGQVVFDNQPVLGPGESGSLIFAGKLSGARKGWQGSGALHAGNLFTSVIDSFIFTTDHYFEDFNQGRTDRFPFMNNSPVPWSPDKGSYHSSNHSLRSGRILDNMESELSIRFEITRADTLSFAYRVSSETNYDFLRFYVDSTLVISWSGETGWKTFSHTLESGDHEITWSYTKDKNISSREDAAWIDDISFPESAFSRGDLSLMEIVVPGSGPWLMNQEPFRIRVRNTSTEPVTGFTAGFSLNGTDFIVGEFAGQLMPGEDVEFTPEILLDLSHEGTYLLGAHVLSDTLGYSGNNGLEKTVVRYDYPDLSLSLAGMDHRQGVRADAIIDVENAGNVPLDTLHYEIWMDDLLSASGSRYIGLHPGEHTLETFRLADSLENRSSGTYGFVIRAVNTDSMMINNAVNGVLFWWATGTVSPDLHEAWRVRPNPATRGFSLELGEPAVQEELFEIVSLSGRVEGSFIVPEGSDRIWISTEFAEPGTYLLRNVNTGISIQVIITR